MKTVFVDANVLFSAAHRPAWTIGRLLISGRAKFLTSPYAIAEARRNLTVADRPALNMLLKYLRVVPDAFGPPPPGVTLRGKDVPILATAAASSAELLVTGDERDFGPLFGRIIGGVKIVSPSELAKEI